MADYSGVLLRPSPRELARRLPQAMVGMLLIGFAVALSIRAELGSAPWDVFHQGLSRRTGLSFGVVAVGVGVIIMVLLIPLRQRMGVVSLINIVMIGPTAQFLINRIHHPDLYAVRVAYLAVSVGLFGIGAGMYVGAALGPGPRDGLMTAMSRRGFAVWKVRTAIEVSVLIGGWLMGGTLGYGTAVLAFGVGPVIQWALQRFHISVER